MTAFEIAVWLMSGLALMNVSTQIVADRAIARQAASVGAGNPRWFVAQTHPHREASACAQLQAQAFEAFLPYMTKTVRHARQLRTVRAPLFPSYVFVSLDLDRDAWRSVNGTFGVSRMVMAGDRPAPAPVGIIEALKALVNERGCVEFSAGLRPGQRIEIVAGPFAEAIGQIEREDANGRVRVLLDIMGGVPAIIDRSVLRAL